MLKANDMQVEAMEGKAWHFAWSKGALIAIFGSVLLYCITG